MPNYNITIDSRFDPYSFEDYLKPLAILQEQHNQAADAYANYLAQSAGMEEALAANPDDVDLLNQYNTYRQTLNDLADDLSKNGISRTTRRGAFQAKADYGNIAKMQEAIKTRDELLKERRALRIKDPSLLFSNEDSDYSIKNVMAGRTNYDALSQDVIKKDVQDTAKNWAKSAMLHMQENSTINPESIKYGYIFREILNGAMPNEIIQAINSGEIEGVDPTDPIVSELKGMVDATVDKYVNAGAKDANGQSIWENRRGDIRNAAAQGLWSTLGDIDYSPIQNWMQKQAASHSKALKGETYSGYNYDVQTGISNANPDLKGWDVIQDNFADKVTDAIRNKKRFQSGVAPIRNNNAINNFNEFVDANYSDLSAADKGKVKNCYKGAITGINYFKPDNMDEILNEYEKYRRGTLAVSQAINISNLDVDDIVALRNKIVALGVGDNIRKFNTVDKDGHIINGEITDWDDFTKLLAAVSKNPIENSVSIKLLDDTTFAKDENGGDILDDSGNKVKNHKQKVMLEFVDNTKDKPEYTRFILPDVLAQNEKDSQWSKMQYRKDVYENMQNDQEFMDSVKKVMLFLEGDPTVKRSDLTELDKRNYNDYRNIEESVNSLQQTAVDSFIGWFPSQKGKRITNNASIGNKTYTLPNSNYQSDNTEQS